MTPDQSSYMPWLAVDHGNRYVVICDSFGPPFGPRLWLFADGSIGVPDDAAPRPFWRFKTLREAWRQAHRLNRETLYAPRPRPRNRKQKGPHES